jgi:hypothetical protein
LAERISPRFQEVQGPPRGQPAPRAAGEIGGALYPLSCPADPFQRSPQVPGGTRLKASNLCRRLRIRPAGRRSYKGCGKRVCLMMKSAGRTTLSVVIRAPPTPAAAPIVGTTSDRRPGSLSTKTLPVYCVSPGRGQRGRSGCWVRGGEPPLHKLHVGHLVVAVVWRSLPSERPASQQDDGSV